MFRDVRVQETRKYLKIVHVQFPSVRRQHIFVFVSWTSPRKVRRNFRSFGYDGSWCPMCAPRSCSRRRGAVARSWGCTGNTAPEKSARYCSTLDCGRQIAPLIISESGSLFQRVSSPLLLSNGRLSRVRTVHLTSVGSTMVICSSWMDQSRTRMCTVRILVCIRNEFALRSVGPNKMLHLVHSCGVLYANVCDSFIRSWCDCWRNVAFCEGGGLCAHGGLSLPHH